MDFSQKYYARIKKIDFTNFRNIEKGCIEFPNANYEDYLINENPSIMGLYGQNGSGKSSVIMSLGILKDVLSGKPIDRKYESCIQSGYDRCTIMYTFSMFRKVFANEKELMNADDDFCFDVYYQFDITTRDEESNDDNMISNIQTKKKIIFIENESLKYRIKTLSKKFNISKQTYIDTSISDKKDGNIFGSSEKNDIYCNFDKNVKQQLKEAKAIAKDKCCSFIFMPKTINTIMEAYGKLVEEVYEYVGMDSISNEYKTIDNDANVIKKISEPIEKLINEDVEKAQLIHEIANIYTPPVEIVSNLRLFGTSYLQVIDTITTGQTNINTTIPLLLWGDGVNLKIMLQMDEATFIPDRLFDVVNKKIKLIGDVLEKIVPDLELKLVDQGKRISYEGKEEHGIEIVSNRKGIEIPLRYESDGIRRLVSILSLLIAVYNEPSFTIAIDELDSGIFEYLLGEILLVMSESAKGQLIFTSHDLRPLEVLPYKYICFTTTNPGKRFTKIPTRGNSNPRDNYYRSIVLNTQKEQIYNPTNKYDIGVALYKAGNSGGSNE